MRWIGSTMSSLLLIAVLGSCNADAGGETTVVTSETVAPVDVAATVVDAILSGNTEVAADWTLLDQMPWMAMAEGASIEQAVGLLEEGSRQVAINYWQGFSEGAGFPDLRVGQVEESEVGGHRFASVVVGSGQRLALVLRMEDRWLVDVIASFGSTLAERLHDAVDIVAANRGPDVDRLAALIAQQRDSVSAALRSASLNESARQALTELGAAIDLLES